MRKLDQLLALIPVVRVFRPQPRGLVRGSESPQCQFPLFLKLGQARKPSYLCPGRTPQMELGGAPNPPAILMVPSLRP